MSLGLEGFNALSETDARAALTRCCGAGRWVTGMLARRPFASAEALYLAASEVWSALSPDDWHEAFSHHPRIGDARAASASTQGWASSEQAGATSADAEIRHALAEGNRAYEAKFGHIYLVCATGKSGAELLRILQSRLGNDADTELRVAAGEQEKITRIRLEKMLFT